MNPTTPSSKSPSLELVHWNALDGSKAGRSEATRSGERGDIKGGKVGSCPDNSIQNTRNPHVLRQIEMLSLEVDYVCTMSLKCCSGVQYQP